MKQVAFLLAGLSLALLGPQAWAMTQVFTPAQETQLELKNCWMNAALILTSDPTEQNALKALSKYEAVRWLWSRSGDFHYPTENSYGCQRRETAKADEATMNAMYKFCQKLVLHLHLYRQS